MSTLIRHGELEIQLPEGWTDQSTLLFQGPPETASRPTLSRIADSNPTVSVRFFHRESADPRDVLAEEFRQLQAMDPGCTMQQQGPLSSELGEGWHLVHRSGDAQEPMQQILACFCLPKTVVLACAQSHAHSFPALEPMLRTILRSLAARKTRPSASEGESV
jgi:hypothetical protein